MKNLTLLNDVTNIKLGDTATTIQFKASDNEEVITLKDSQKATFRVRNAIGFLKSISANVVMNNQIFQFDSTNLVGLVPDTYYLELVITNSDNTESIYPDDGFVTLNITENALKIIGEQLPNMSLDDFENQIKSYIDSLGGSSNATITVEDINEMLDLFNKYYQIDASRASAGINDYNYYDKNNLTLYNYNYDGAATEYYPYNSVNGGESTLRTIRR